MSENAVLRRNLVSSFQHSGLKLRTDAADYFAETLSSFEDSERELWIDKLTEYCLTKLSTSIIEREHIKLGILHSCQNETEDDNNLIEVVSAFETPRFEYCYKSNKYFITTKNCQLLPNAMSKGALFIERYQILQQITSRNPLFRACAEGNSPFRLYQAEQLLGSGIDIENVLMLGMLSQLEEGKYFLEDVTGAIPVDLTETTYHDGLFCENSFVLAEGRYCDETLLIDALGLPPREPSETTRVYFGVQNTFGGSSNISLRDSERLKRIELKKKDAMIVILSDVWLDDPKVIDKLEVLFQGYSESPPVAFIIMGNFVSSQDKSIHRERFKDGFAMFSEILKQFPNITNSSHFVIIPGTTDCLLPGILPRPSIPEFMVGSLRNTVKNLTLATNPARVRYCTQELVFIKENIVTKMCRNSIHFPESKDIGYHFAKTIICQVNLTPLPHGVCPVHWEYNPSMVLYPCPDLVVVGDQLHSFTEKIGNCLVVNTGSFSKHNFSFKVYYPATGELEESELPQEESSDYF